MRFDQNYTNYWQSATSKSLDGLRIPGMEEVKKLLPYLLIGKEDKVFDLGCSYGRMYDELAVYSAHIYGIDPDPYAVEQAAQKGYQKLWTGTAEETHSENEFFDRVFSWQVFDVVDHIKGLTEINRILKIGGRFLITGKNYQYHEDDKFAFTAEKNANLKSFPNRFTMLDELTKNIAQFGFEIEKILLFARRGDFGQLKYKEMPIDEPAYLGYEYMYIGKKTASIESTAVTIKSLDRSFSATAEEMARGRGFASARALFESIGID